MVNIARPAQIQIVPIIRHAAWISDIERKRGSLQSDLYTH